MKGYDVSQEWSVVRGMRANLVVAVLNDSYPLPQV